MTDNHHLTHLLIALSSNIFNEGLRRVAEEKPLYQVACLHDCPPDFQPDIILFDADQNLPQLTSTYPKAKTILLDTCLKEQKTAYFLVNYNVKGIISPHSSVEMFHKAVKMVRQGEIWIDQKYLKNLLWHNAVIGKNADIKSLSTQDRKIVNLIGQGLKNREIGEKLCLSEHTIKAHVSRIYRRLNVSNRAQLASLVSENHVE